MSMCFMIFMVMFVCVNLCLRASFPCAEIAQAQEGLTDKQVGIIIGVSIGVACIIICIIVILCRHR